SSHSRFIERFTHPAPIPLIRNGHAVPENMRREFVSHEQLMSIVREQGVEKYRMFRLHSSKEAATPV
ncbi:MAG TPA: YetF domain-containing protein, partial [Terriglobia bacterium]|nr:YetF domain-containing protein [Terriglobia bacterium]